MDYGRWTLIISDKTQSLKQIPEITSAQNVHHETREFSLADYGPAKIVETDDEIDPEDADYRAYYVGDSQNVKEKSVKYVKGAYLAHSDEPAYLRSSAQLAAYHGQFSQSREIIKVLIDQGQATENDLNLYAWYALLLPPPIDAETIDTAVRANDLSKNADFAILHTLACVYAQDGKTGQARELLLKAIDALHLEEPNPEVWFGLALIAEQCGEIRCPTKDVRAGRKTKIRVSGGILCDSSTPSRRFDKDCERFCEGRRTVTVSKEGWGLRT